MARRVMDLGDAGHILMPSTMVEILMELSDEYKEIIRPMHDYQLKHKVRILLYSVYGESFGNPKMPTKRLSDEPKLHEDIDVTKKNFVPKNRI